MEAINNKYKTYFRPYNKIITNSSKYFVVPHIKHLNKTKKPLILDQIIIVV